MSEEKQIGKIEFENESDKFMPKKNIIVSERDFNEIRRHCAEESEPNEELKELAKQYFKKCPEDMLIHSLQSELDRVKRDEIIEKLKAKYKPSQSTLNYSEAEWTAVDSYNHAIAEAIEIVEAALMEGK